MKLSLWSTSASAASLAVQLMDCCWRALTAVPVLGPYLRDSYILHYLYGTLWTTSAVFMQKLHMHHLGHIDSVGGSASGLTAIVTGPTSGIGTETAASLARKGATVILACRNIAKGEALQQEIEKECARGGLPRPKLEVRQLDLSSLVSVKDFASAWEKEGRQLHILVNNAGIYSMGAPREETVDGFESHMGCNHLAHYLLTLSLMPSLKRGAAANPQFGARIVNVSSSVHLVAVRGINKVDPHLTRPGGYSAEQAYGCSKLAQIQFTRELRRRLGKNSPVQAFSLHPGMVMTDVVRTLPRWVQVAHRNIMGLILLHPIEGARASVYCATSPAAPREGDATGGYFNANCKAIQPSKAAQDQAGALWLWRWSAQQVKLPAALDLPEP